MVVGLVDQHLSLCHFGHVYSPLSSAAHSLPSLQGFTFPPFLLLAGICRLQAQCLRAKGEHHHQLYN